MGWSKLTFVTTFLKNSVSSILLTAHLESAQAVKPFYLLKKQNARAGAGTHLSNVWIIEFILDLLNWIYIECWIYDIEVVHWIACSPHPWAPWGRNCWREISLGTQRWDLLSYRWSTIALFEGVGVLPHADERETRAMILNKCFTLLRDHSSWRFPPVIIALSV